MEKIYLEKLINSYSKRFIDRVKIRAYLERNWTSTVSLNYAPKIYESIKRPLNYEGIRVTLTSTNTLGKSFTHVKDSLPKYNASQLVNKLLSQDCTKVYIGETTRSVADSSAIAFRVLETQHHVDFDNPAEVLANLQGPY